jgi:GAF domain-containing protein
LHVLVTRCVRLFDADAAGIMLADPAGALRVVASSMEQARILELLEVQNEEGPCLDCFKTGVAVIDDDLETSDRWPRFRQDALSAGFHAVQAVPMRLRDRVIGSLNLFRARTGRLDDADVAACQALADVATISLLQERAMHEARLLAEQLQLALNNRIVIEQAKGTLAERAGIDMATAFDLLRGYARDNNRLLADVGRDVIERRLTLGDHTSAAET